MTTPHRRSVPDRMNAPYSLTSNADRMQAITDEVSAMADTPNLTSAHRRRFEELRSEFAALDRDRNIELERIRDAANGAPGTAIERGTDPGPPRDTGPVSKFSGNPWSRSERLAPVDRARYAIDALVRDSRGLEAETQAAAEKVTRALDGTDGSVNVNHDHVARWTAVTSNPQYRSAWVKLARDPQNGHREFTADELTAFQEAQSEARAMSLTDAAGGYLVPFQLDPTVIVTNAGGTNPLRRVARQVVATGDVWNGVSSSGVTSRWAAEATEANDDSPPFVQPTVVIHKMDSFVPISIEAFEDEANVTAEVAKLLTDNANEKEAEALQVGTGSGQPFGIVTALDGVQEVATATADVIVLADISGLQSAVPARFRSGNVAWLANLTLINRDLRTKSWTTNGESIVRDTAETGVFQMLGWPLYDASFMDATVTAGAGNDNFVIAGDFENYVIADRIGTRIEFVPHLFGANRRPTGQRGWYMYRRVGGDSVNDAAFRMLVA